MGASKIRIWCAFALMSALLAGAGVVGTTPTAHADTPLYVDWTTLLPSWSDTCQPSSDNDCAAGRPNCVYSTIREMQRRFAPLGQSCAHNAVFSLAYLRTTQTYLWARDQAGYFQDTAFVNHEDAVFAKYYF